VAVRHLELFRTDEAPNLWRVVVKL